MSVFQMSAAATDKLFLEYVMPGLHVEVRENTVLYDRFGTDSEHVFGKYALFKAATAAPTSVRPSSSSSLPTPKQSTYDEFTVYLKRGLYGQMQFDGLALACGRGKGAVMEILESEIKMITIQIGNKLNRQYHGDGSGRLAQLYAAVANSTTVIVDGPLFGQDAAKRTNPANYLDIGQEIDIYTTAGVLQAESAIISAITDNGDGTATLTLEAAISASADAYIFDHDTYAASHAAGTGVPIGLNGIINTANPYLGITQVYFQGLNRAAKTWAQAQNVSCSSLPISDEKLLELIMKQERYGRVGAILSNDIIYRAFYSIHKDDKIMPNATSFWGGFEGLTFYGGRKGKIPMIYDTDMPDNLVYTLDDSQIKIYAPSDGGLTWMPGDKGILTRVQGKDESVASLVYYYNMGSPNPQALGYLSAVKHAAS